MRSLLYNLSFLLSYALLPASIGWYLFQKCVSSLLFGTMPPRLQGILNTPDDPADRPVCISGFRHSANSYLVSNLDRGVHRLVLSHHHRAFEPHVAERRGWPVLLLMRNPADVAFTTARRTAAGWQGQKHPIHPAVCLLCWMLFYRSSLRVAPAARLVDFTLVTGDYRCLRGLLQTRLGISLKPTPSLAGVNSFDEGTNVVDGGWLTSWIERRASAMYAELRTRALQG